MEGFPLISIYYLSIFYPFSSSTFLSFSPSFPLFFIFIISCPYVSFRSILMWTNLAFPQSFQFSHCSHFPDLYRSNLGHSSTIGEEKFLLSQLAWWGNSCEYINAIIFIGLKSHFINIFEGLLGWVHVHCGKQVTSIFFSPRILRLSESVEADKQVYKCASQLQCCSTFTSELPILDQAINLFLL